MKKSLFPIVVLLVATTAFQSCKKSEDAKADEAMVNTTEDVITQTDFSAQLDLDVDLAIEERGGGSNLCPTITFAQPWGQWPNTVTIDFGSGL
ncbi:MAG: hypothetical protein IPL65_13605 [Lewinellaceae bacterium]|nr:hypothetical protein [Lewinellaceae bacterium]